MDRHIISKCFILTLLFTCSIVFGQDEDAKTRRAGVSRRPSQDVDIGRLVQMREREAAERRSDQIEEQLQTLETEITGLQTGHEKLIGELKTVLELAKKEKAKETTQHIKELIDKHQETFQDRLQKLERKRQRLQRAQQEIAKRLLKAEIPGRKAPDFTLTSFGGKTVNLSDYKDKIVVLEWFNFECPFSLYHYEKANTMVELAKKYKSKNVVWLAVNSTSHITPEKNIEFARKYKLPFPILDDRSGKVGRAYRARTTPHMYIINRYGYIVYEGAIDNAPLGQTKEAKVNYVDKALAELTSGKPVSVAKTEPYGCSVKYGRPQ